MQKLSIKHTAAALAAAALLAACGGGGSTPGADVPGVISGDTGTCTAAPCYNFSEANLGLVPFGNLGSAVAADPKLATNKVAKLTKDATSETWAGVTVHVGGASNSVPRIDASKTISLRVYSPAVGKTIMIKIENAANGGVFKEASAKSTKASEWETLTFTFADDAAATFNKISVFPGFDTKVAEVYYIDELKYSTKADDPAPVVKAVAFASGYTAVDAASVGYAYQGKSTEGGNFNWTVANGGTYGWGGEDFWWSGIASADATPSFYWGGKGKADQDYMESWVNSPSNTALTLTGQTKIRMTVWGNDELVGAPRFTPVIQLAEVSGCYPRAEAAPLTPVSKGADAATYNVALSDFVVKENCGTAMSVAQFMAKPIGSVRVRIYKANYFNKDNAYGSPNGMNVGPISFQP